MEWVKAEGSHYEIGRRCGEVLAETIKRCMAARKVPEAYCTAAHDEIRAKVETNVRREAPELLEELRGVADGSGISYDNILTLNCISQMWDADNVASRLCERACTGVGFCDTPDGVIIGKNNDGGSESWDDVPHWFTYPSGRRALFISWPGTVWAWCWVNDAGLCCNGSSVSSAGFNRDGIPSQMLTRLMLERCETVAEAVELMREVPIMSGAVALTLGDAHGNLVAVEQDVDCQALRYPEQGAVFTTNFFATPQLADRCTAEPRYVANARDRFENLKRLTRQVEHTVEGMKQILRDHTQPGGICQHTSILPTYNSFIMLARQRALLITDGRPCENEYQRLELDAPPM